MLERWVGFRGSKLSKLILQGVNFLRRLALHGGKNLMTTRFSMLLKSRASPDMLPFSLCNKKILAIRHMNRPLFPTSLSIPSYDIGKYFDVFSTVHHNIELFHQPTLMHNFLCFFDRAS